MANVYCWDVDCNTDGVQAVWAANEPTECPIDVGHTVSGVVRSTGVPQQGGCVEDALYINDGADRVFEISVDQDGALSTTQIGGPPPA